MGLDLMKVFNDYIMPSTIETLDQLVDKFNEASAGTIVLTTAGYTGDFFQASFFQSLHAAQRRVDRYGTNSAVATTDLRETKDSMVKVAGGFGPVLFEPGQMTWLERSPLEAIEAISRNFAEALMKDQLNTAILALVAALSNVAACKYDGIAETPNKGISQQTLNKAHAKFGDHSSSIVAEVMTGTVFHKLIGQAINNTEQLFQAGNVTVVEAVLGRRFIVTDAPALFEDASPVDKEKVLGLTTGAATVADGGDIITNIATTNGKERIETTFQADYTFMLGLKGFTWDEVNGGKSPTDAELSTGSNWDKTVTSHKHTAGVIAIGDAAVGN